MIVWNIIQIQLCSLALWPGHGFWVCVHCDIDLGDMTLGQGHWIPCSHWRQWCDKSSTSNMTVRSYGPDTDFRYVCTVTLTLKIWSWVKIMTRLLVTGNNCVIYYADRTSGYKGIVQNRCEQIDRQTDRKTDRQGDFYITPNFVCGCSRWYTKWT